MRRERVIVALSILLIIGAAVYGIDVRQARAQGSAGKSDATVSEKLDSILQNQKSIMEDLASIKEDLRIIKIRITQAQ